VAGTYPASLHLKELCQAGAETPGKKYYTIIEYENNP
jgi:hypothetical protein